MQLTYRCKISEMYDLTILMIVSMGDDSHKMSIPILPIKKKNVKNITKLKHIFKDQNTIWLIHTICTSIHVVFFFYF